MTTTLTARMSKNGQVVMPSKIRKQRGLSEGAIFRVIDTAEGILFSPMQVPGETSGYEAQEQKVQPVAKKEEHTTREPNPNESLSYEDIKKALELSMR
ncbi:MAG: AbrB/MazE/SpoVT family DNA-binding domain-containing protein [Candidatus Woesearchaeota archaeon]